MKAKLCDVVIFKRVEVTIVKNVYEHEIPVVEQVFGEGNVTRYPKHEMVFPEGKRYQVKAETPVVYPVEEIDYEEEYYRLATQYKNRAGSDISNVEYVYGKLEDRKLEKINEEKYGTSVLEPTDSIVEDKPEEDEVLNYQSMTNAELRELLKELKVKFPPTAPKAILISLLNKADQGILEPS